MSIYLRKDIRLKYNTGYGFEEPYISLEKRTTCFFNLFTKWERLGMCNAFDVYGFKPWQIVKKIKKETLKQLEKDIKAFEESAKLSEFYNMYK